MNGDSTPVYFSRHAYGYRAEPGNAVVPGGGSVAFSNYTDDELVLQDFRVGWVGAAEPAAQAERLTHAVKKASAGRKASAHVHTSALPSDAITLPPGGSVTVRLEGLAPGQYFYRALVAGPGLEVQGGSSPGIIITG